MIHGDRSAGKAWSTKETELGRLHVDTFLGRIEVRGVPIAEVACAFKLHEADYRATGAGGQFLPLQKNMKTRTILSV